MQDVRRSPGLTAQAICTAAGLAFTGIALAGCAVDAMPPPPVLPPSEHLPEQLPEATTSWFALGSKLLAAGNPAQAERAFIRSLRVEGTRAAAFTGAGVAAQRQGLLTEAKRYFERAKELDPASVAAHNNLGAALYGLGELRSAQHAFGTAMALSSGTSPEVARNLAMAEQAIESAEAENAPLAENPWKLHRLGSAEYKLKSASGQPDEG